MTSWLENIHHRSSILVDQISIVKSRAIRDNIDLSGLLDFYNEKIYELFDEELPLAKILDNSDVVIHASGPCATPDSPSLKAFNWICDSVNKNIKNLTKNILYSGYDNSDKIAKKLDIRFNGYASGSIYAGFSIAEQKGLFDIGVEGEFHYRIKEMLDVMTCFAKIVGKENRFLNSELSEIESDPAHRDAIMEALWGISPSGKNGIDKIDISTKSVSPSSLHVEDRAFLKKYLKRDYSPAGSRGSFLGVVREIDLDASRFHLRGVKGIGSIRCVFDNKKIRNIRSILDSEVKIVGQYEKNKEGIPRLMKVESIEVIEGPVQYEIKQS